MISRKSFGMSFLTGVFLAALLVAMGWLALLLLRDDAAGTMPFAVAPGDRGELSEGATVAVAFAEFAPIRLGDFVPTALAVAPDGSILVAGAGRLMFLDAPALAGKDAVVPRGARKTLALSGDATPTCLAVGGDGTAYVGFPARIDAFSPDGTVRTVANFAPSARITSIIVCEADLFAADAGNRVVCQIRLADGAILREIGRPGAAAEPGRGFVVPSPYFDVAPGADDSLWVVNPGHHRLENYAANGTLLRSWQRIGSEVADFCGCCNPIHIAILPDGSFLTAEKGIPRVKVHDPDGEFRELVAGPEAFDEGTIPGDVAMVPDGRVLVLDPVRRQIRVFQRK
jgi:hypothetical protein